MKTLVQDIQARLASAMLPAPPDGAPESARQMYRKSGRLFEYVDIDWGQVDFYNGFPPPVKFPAALLDITSATYSNEGRLTQVGVIDVQVRIVDLILSNSSHQAPESMRQAAYRIFDTMNATNRLLHGWTGTDSYGTLTRTGVVKVNRPDGLKEYRLTYRVQLADTSAVRAVETVPTKPRVTARLLLVADE